MDIRQTQRADARKGDWTVTQSAEKIELPLASLVINLLGQSPDCVKILSMDGCLEFMNCNGQEAMQIANFADVQGKVWWDLWPDDSREMVRKAFNKAACGSDVAFDAECPTMTGENRRWSVQLSAMLTSTGMPIAVLCTSREIAYKNGAP